MTTKEFTHLTGQQTGPILNTRLLGTLGILGSSMLLVEGLYVGFQQHGTDQFIGLIGAIYMTGWAGSILGLRTLKAAGSGWGGKAVLTIQLIGLFLAAVWSAFHLVAPDPTTEHWLYIGTDTACPLSHLFMNIVGIAVLRAKVWTGWRRFTPFWCGLAFS